METQIIVLTHNGLFIDALSKETDLLEWATEWITSDDRDICFWEGGHIDIKENCIEIWGDNGFIELDLLEKDL